MCTIDTGCDIYFGTQNSLMIPDILVYGSGLNLVNGVYGLVFHVMVLVLIQMMCSTFTEMMIIIGFLILATCGW